MPISQSAKKTQRSSEKKAIYNLRRIRTVRIIVKEIDALLKDNKVDEAEKKLKDAYKAIDKAAKMNTLNKNTASRKKSRLSKRISKAKASK